MGGSEPSAAARAQQVQRRVDVVPFDAAEAEEEAGLCRGFRVEGRQGADLQALLAQMTGDAQHIQRFATARREVDPGHRRQRFEPGAQVAVQAFQQAPATLGVFALQARVWRAKSPRWMNSARARCCKVSLCRSTSLRAASTASRRLAGGSR